ncbi:MAG TPA: hypothetical protein ENJ09_13165 [Planctomycetes bacterium]|nr:hypothetical protein [Planctomycetota bacterium]
MSRFARVVALLAGVLLVGVALLLRSLAGQGAQAPGSSLSRGPNGRDLALLLLNEMGFRARAFRGAPGELPDGGALLFLEAPPPDIGLPEKDGSRSSRSRDPLHYRRFVEGGGTLVVASGGEMSEFLERTLGIAMGGGVDRSGEKPTGTQPAILPDGDRLALSWHPEARFATPSPTEPFEVVLADPGGDPLAVRIALPEWNGGGVLVFAQDLSFLDNDRIGNGDNALLLVRLAETYAGDRPILFDEYVLGGWQPPSLLALAFGRTALPFSAHALLLLLVLIVRAAWVRAFPRDPEPLAGVSALARARGVASLLADAGRWGLLAEFLRRGVLREFAGRVRGLRVEDRPTGDELRALLAEVLPNADGVERERWVALFEAEVGDRDGFFELARSLALLETSHSSPYPGSETTP